MKTQHLIDGYRELLSRYRWQWFATLTFRGTPSFRKTDQAFRLWLSEIDEAVGTADFHWFRVTEHGAFGNNLHYHLLLGGLRDASKWDWILRWEELAGEAVIHYFFPCRGAITYILKTARPGCDFEIDFDLP